VYPKSGGGQSNYIIVSDVHLGADLVQHVRPWTVSRLKQVARVDRDLAAMLDYYRAHADPERPWKLVIAGDLVDFIGMNIAPLPGSPLETELSGEERLYGLGSTGGHAAAKMRAVAARHSMVFERLAAFVADGHELVLIRGNHDVDFHWESAQDAFVQALVDRANGAADDAAQRAELVARIHFHPWFFYEEGLLYVEHGHQFDAMCSYHNLLAPVSPRDHRRISWSFSDILLRMVVRPTRGLRSEGHDYTTALEYVKLGVSLGIGGGARLFYRYASAILRACGRWWAHMGDRAQALRALHERRVEELAMRMRIGVDKLRAISALWPAPVTRGLLAVFRSMFLDRIFVAIGVPLLLAALLLVVPTGMWLAIAASMLAIGGVFFLWSARRRLMDLDPTEAMRRGARRIAQLLPSRLVVMGHTHRPEVVRVSDESTYVNLGTWAVDDLDGEVPEAQRMHLVVRWVGDRFRAEFYRWDTVLGPVLEPLLAPVLPPRGT